MVNIFFPLVVLRAIFPELVHLGGLTLQLWVFLSPTPWHNGMSLLTFSQWLQPEGYIPPSCGLEHRRSASRLFSRELPSEDHFLPVSILGDHALQRRANSNSTNTSDHIQRMIWYGPLGEINLHSWSSPFLLTDLSQRYLQSRRRQFYLVHEAFNRQPRL